MEALDYETEVELLLKQMKMQLFQSDHYSLIDLKIGGVILVTEMGRLGKDVIILYKWRAVTKEMTDWGNLKKDGGLTSSVFCNN